MTNYTPRSLIQHKTSGDVYVTNGEMISGPVYYGDHSNDGELKADLDLGDFDLEAEVGEDFDLSEYRILLSE